MDVRRVEDDEDLEDALAVRREVFVEEQGVPVDRELDGRDDAATHVVAYEDGTAVGAARLRPYQGTTGKVERVAVVDPQRGNGLGVALMDAVEDIAAGEGYDELVLHAQVPVVEFYVRLGYGGTGEEFEDAGILHREMRKQL